MANRQLFDSSEIVDTDDDQGWNFDVEQAYLQLEMGSLPADNNTFAFSAENTVNEQGSFTSQWGPGPTAVGYSSSGLNVEIPHFHPQVPGPYPDPIIDLSSAGSFPMVQQGNYAHHASSSHSHHGELDGGAFDFTTGNRRGGPYKRKSPSVPAVSERGSMSQYYDPGSSSNISMPINTWQEKQISDSYHTSWDVHVPPSCRGGHSLTIRTEDTQRNVRSRAAYEFDANLARPHLSLNPFHNANSLPTDRSNPTGIWGQGPSPSTRQWNNNPVIPTAHSGTVVPETNPSGHGMNNFNAVSGNTPSAAALEIGGYQNDYALSLNPFSQNRHGNVSQSSVRGVRSSHTQRSGPNSRASSSNLCPGHGAASDEGLNAVGESYPPRHSRLTIRDRNGRSRISNDRYRSLADEAVPRNGFPPPVDHGIMDRSAMYGAGGRALLDQHRNMRLDVDNMSYEELLALGDRIGNVNTGLSDILISKCLTESIYCSSDQAQEEGTCVICLEEYKHMDDVGTFKVCGHDFHVECIRKWLSMKNMCPICKGAAVDDKTKQS